MKMKMVYVGITDRLDQHDSGNLIDSYPIILNEDLNLVREKSTDHWNHMTDHERNNYKTRQNLYIEGYKVPEEVEANRLFDYFCYDLELACNPEPDYYEELEG